VEAIDRCGKTGFSAEKARSDRVQHETGISTKPRHLVDHAY
jgi:hypothetical protein